MDYYEELAGLDVVGCCLDCPNSYDGCLCPDCMCTKCDMYDGNNSCCKYPDVWAEERTRNIQVLFTTNEFGHTLIRVKTTGPVDKKDYADFKLFLQEHFKYNFEVEAWEVYSENWLFVKSLRKALKVAHFLPEEIVAVASPLAA